LQFLALLTVAPGWRGFVSASRLFWSCAWSREPRAWVRLWQTAAVVDGIDEETAMDSDWLWVMLALGIFLPVGMVPVALARNACCWWRGQRRGRR